MIHYTRSRKGQDMDAPRRRKWGTGHINGQGYKVLFVDGKYTGEHRVVMSNKLGRKLLDHEEVHHLNGQRADNRPENLELWSTSQPKGQRIEDKVAWTKEILALYGDYDEK